MSLGRTHHSLLLIMTTEPLLEEDEDENPGEHLQLICRFMSLF